MPARAPKIGDMCYRVALCTMNDVVLEGDAMTLSREVVTFTWASITHQWNQPSFIGKEGYAVKELRDRPTHLITVRYGLQLDYTSAAWVYEQRLKSPPRWYKVVGFAEQASGGLCCTAIWWRSLTRRRSRQDHCRRSSRSLDCERLHDRVQALASVSRSQEARGDQALAGGCRYEEPRGVSLWHGRFVCPVEAGRLAGSANGEAARINGGRDNAEFSDYRHEHALFNLSSYWYVQDGASKNVRRRVERGHAKGAIGEMGRMVALTRERNYD